MESKLEFLVTCSIDNAIDLAPKLLRDDFSQIKAATNLLERIRRQNDNEAGINKIMRCLRLHMFPNQLITEQMVQLLFCTEHVLPLIHYMGKLVGNSEQETRKVVDAYKELLCSDRSFLVPIIGSLSDLSLSEQLKKEVVDLTVASLAIVSEEDIPTVVRTLLQMVTRDTGNAIVQVIRQECVDLSSSTQFILMEVFGSMMRSNPSIARIVLQTLRKSHELSTFDVLLLLLSMESCEISNARNSAIIQLFRAKSLRFSTLKDVSTRIQDPEVATLLAPLLVLCQLLISFADGEHLELAHDLLILLFDHHPSARQQIVFILLSLTTLGETKPSLCSCATRVIVNLATNYTDFFSPYSHLLMEHLNSLSMNASPGCSMDKKIIDALCYSVSWLCKSSPGLETSVIISLQKQLLSVNSAQNLLDLHQQTHPQRIIAVIYATHLLTNTPLNEKDKQSLISWVLRILPAASEEVSSSIVSMLNQVKNVLPASSRRQIFAHHIVPALQRSSLLNPRSLDREKRIIVFTLQQPLSNSAAPPPTSNHPMNQAPQLTKPHGKSRMKTSFISVVSYVNKHYPSNPPSRYSYEEDSGLYINRSINSVKSLREMWKCYMSFLNDESCILQEILRGFDMPSSWKMDLQSCPCSTSTCNELAWCCICAMQIAICTSNYLFRCESSNISKLQLLHLAEAAATFYDKGSLLSSSKLQVDRSNSGGHWDMVYIQAIKRLFSGNEKDVLEELDIKLIADVLVDSSPKNYILSRFLLDSLLRYLEEFHSKTNPTQYHRSLATSSTHDPLNSHQVISWLVNQTGVLAQCEDDDHENHALLSLHYQIIKEIISSSGESNHKNIIALGLGTGLLPDDCEPTVQLCREALLRFISRQFNKNKERQLACFHGETLVVLTKGLKTSKSAASHCLTSLQSVYSSSNPFISLTNVFPPFALTLLPETIMNSKLKAGSSLLRWMQQGKHLDPVTGHLRYNLVTVWSLLPRVLSMDFLHSLLTHMEQLVDSTKSIPSTLQSLCQKNAKKVFTGEHTELKTLTVATFHDYLETIVRCSVATLRRMRPQYHKQDPFLAIHGSMELFRRITRLFCRAEKYGISMLAQCTLAMLQSSICMSQEIQYSIDICVKWRSQSPNNGIHQDEEIYSVSHMPPLFDHAEKTLNVLQKLTKHIGDIHSANKNKRKRMNGKGFNILPKLRHSLEKLDDYLKENRSIFNIPRTKTLLSSYYNFGQSEKKVSVFLSQIDNRVVPDDTVALDGTLENENDGDNEDVGLSWEQEEEDNSTDSEDVQFEMVFDKSCEDKPKDDVLNQSLVFPSIVVEYNNKEYR